MKKAFTLLFFVVSISIFSQENNFWNNVRFGGGLGLGFGNNSTTVAVSPAAVYDFKGGFSLGAGLNYTYFDRNNNTANIYGGSILSMYNIPVVNLQLSGEYEHSFVNQTVNNVDFSRDVPALYLGLAYRTGFASFGLRYDVLHDKNKSIYSSAISPIVRIFF